MDKNIFDVKISETNADEKQQLEKRHKYNVITFSLALTLLSFAIVCQINFEYNSAQALENQSTESLVAMVRSLNEYRANLDDELTALEKSRNNLSATAALEKQLQNSHIFAGLTAVHGPGISVTITADYDIYDMDIIDIANELKVSGAEAIAINNHRLTAKSHITSETDQNDQLYLALDGERLLTPIVVTAIGDAATLEKGLLFTGGIIDNLNTLYGIYPIVRQEEDITIPAANINTSPAYMRSAQ